LVKPTASIIVSGIFERINQEIFVHGLSPKKKEMQERAGACHLKDRVILGDFSPGINSAGSHSLLASIKFAYLAGKIVLMRR
jgi:hypothetical protein